MCSGALECCHSCPFAARACQDTPSLSWILTSFFPHWPWSLILSRVLLGSRCSSSSSCYPDVHASRRSHYYYYRLVDHHLHVQRCRNATTHACVCQDTLSLSWIPTSFFPHWPWSLILSRVLLGSSRSSSSSCYPDVHASLCNIPKKFIFSRLL
jgi:hypothetical protein